VYTVTNICRYIGKYAPHAPAVGGWGDRRIKGWGNISFAAVEGVFSDQTMGPAASVSQEPDPP
jgi:hypothetical protein